MYVKDFATPCFSPVLAKNRLTGNPFFSWSDSKSGQNREGCSIQNLLTCRKLSLPRTGEWFFPNPERTGY